VGSNETSLPEIDVPTSTPRPREVLPLPLNSSSPISSEAPALLIAEPESEPGLPRSILPKFIELHEQNPHLAGWIRIPGTAVDYPVLQSPDSDWNFYLNRNFYREHDLHGIPYIWPQHNIAEDDLIFIFGHNMRNGSRFADVAKYIDQAFFERHPVIMFDTLYAEGRYEIAFVFQVFVVEHVNQYYYHQETGIADRTEFPYTFVTAWETEADFWRFIDNSKAHTLYETGVAVEYGDRMIALWTCISAISEAHRLVVVAVER